MGSLITCTCQSKSLRSAHPLAAALALALALIVALEIALALITALEVALARTHALITRAIRTRTLTRTSTSTRTSNSKKWARNRPVLLQHEHRRAGEKANGGRRGAKVREKANVAGLVGRGHAKKT